MAQLPESHPGSDRRLHPLHVLKDYWAIARDPQFLPLHHSGA